MQRLVIGLTVLLLAAPLVSLAVGGEGPAPVAAERVRPPEELLDPTSITLPPESAASATATFTMPGEDSIFRLAAEVAWQYVDSQHQPTTGLVNSVISYPYATVWDMGSMLAAYYSANRLGLLADDEYRARMGNALETLQALPLFDGAGFNKNYQIVRGAPAGRNDRDYSEGYGWSSTDIGRLLVWLRIVAAGDPEHAAAAGAVVERLDLQRIVREGSLWGEDLTTAGQRRMYPEGSIGYEQYAAAGFALWDAYADNALTFTHSSREIEVLGVPLRIDYRGGNLTSEPFILLGLEVGWWSPQWRELALGVLAAQEARFQETGQVTVVTEDAIPVAPHYFYYYGVYGDDEEFPVRSLTGAGTQAAPRWISTKGAFGWYAIEPGAYTWRGVQAVLPAADPDVGWSSGVYERDGRPTGGQNINTSAVVLEAALYHQVREPLLTAAVREASRQPTP